MVEESGGLTAAHNQHGGVPGWLRFLCLLAAVIAGTIGYLHLFVEFYPWWSCLIELAAGSVFLGVALHGDSAVAAPESAARRGRRLLAWLVTAGAAGLGCYCWTVPGRELSMLAAGCVAVAAFFCARWVPFAAEDVRALTGNAAAAAPRGDAQSWMPAMLAVIAVGLGVAAGAVNVAQFHLAAFLLWLSSLALFALAMFAAADDQVAAAPPPWVADGGPQLSRRSEATALLLILTLALALRLPLLADVPALVDSDEGRQGRYAEKLWHEGFPDAFGLGWNGFAT